jgi:hypothetical protein
MPFDLEFFKRKLEQAVEAHNQLLEQEQAIAADLNAARELRVQAYGAVLQAQAMAQEAEAAEKSQELSEDDDAA